VHRLTLWRGTTPNSSDSSTQPGSNVRTASADRAHCASSRIGALITALPITLDADHLDGVRVWASSEPSAPAAWRFLGLRRLERHAGEGPGTRNKTLHDLSSK
jgi:hypothetical protein